jgi:type II secretion system protein J
MSTLRKKEIALVRGYTLIELMVALVIITISSLTVYRTFTSGWFVWDKAIKRIEAIRSARSFIKILTKDLKTIVAAEPVSEEALKVLKDIKREYFKLIGSENSLEMICYSKPVTSYWPEYFPRRSSICYVSYFINTDEKTSSVYRRVKWYNAVLPYKDEEIEKFDNIVDVKFSFLNDYKGNWETSWSTDEMIKLMGFSYRGLFPRCVKVNVTSKSGDIRPQEISLETTISLIAFER